MNRSGPRRQPQPTARVLLAFAGLVALVLGLTWLTSAALPPPPITHPGELARWARGQDVFTSALACVALVATLAGWYLVIATASQLLASLTRRRHLLRFARWFSIPPIRQALTAIAGISLTASATAVAAAGPRHRPPPAVATGAVARPRSLMHPVDGSEPAILHRLPADGDGDGTATLRLLHPGDPGTATLGPAPSAGTASLRAERAPAPAAVRTWTVAPGDSFWAISQRVLTDAWHRAPSDAELVPYWQQLIAANRTVLADPGNADLIFPGQVFVVPAPPPPPSA